MSRPLRTLALDLGSASFKLAVVEGAADAARVVQVRRLELAAGADAAARQAALAQLLQGIPREGLTRIVSVVDDPFLCVRQITLPPMPPAELAGAVAWELQSTLAMPAEQAVVGYQLLGAVAVDGVNKSRLLAAAIPSALVRDHLAMLTQAGLAPTQCVPRAVAVASWVRRAMPGSAHALAVLDIGATSSDFLVQQGGSLGVVRKLPIAGGDLTKAMTSVLMTPQGQVGLTEAEAEGLKRTLGIPQAGDGSEAVRGMTKTQLLSMLRGPLEQLAVEVERSIAFSADALGGSAISALWLVGGGAHLQGFPQWLGQQLGLPVTCPTPLEMLAGVPGGAEAAVVAAPLSLVPVLGAALDDRLTLNLIPAEVRAAATAHVRRAAITAVLTAFLVGVILVRVGLAVGHHVLQTKIAAAQLEQSVVTPQLAMWRASLAAQDARAQRPPWAELFKALSHLTPREMFLTSLAVDDHTMTIRGRVRDLGRPADVVLAEFMRTLANEWWADVTLGSSRRLEQPAPLVEFDLRCRVK